MASSYASFPWCASAPSPALPQAECRPSSPAGWFCCGCAPSSPSCCAKEAESNRDRITSGLQSVRTPLPCSAGSRTKQERHEPLQPWPPHLGYKSECEMVKAKKTIASLQRKEKEREDSRLPRRRVWGDIACKRPAFHTRAAARPNQHLRHAVTPLTVARLASSASSQPIARLLSAIFQTFLFFTLFWPFHRFNPQLHALYSLKDSLSRASGSGNHSPALSAFVILHNP